MITFYVQKRKLSCHRVWQMTHCLFKYAWSASRGDSALLSYKVTCLLDRSGSMNWQPSSRVNFLFCVFSCLFTAAVFHLYTPTKMGFRQNTPQHPKFWNTEIKKTEEMSLSTSIAIPRRCQEPLYTSDWDLQSVNDPLSPLSYLLVITSECLTLHPLVKSCCPKTAVSPWKVLRWTTYHMAFWYTLLWKLNLLKR